MCKWGTQYSENIQEYDFKKHVFFASKLFMAFFSNFAQISDTHCGENFLIKSGGEKNLRLPVIPVPSGGAFESSQFCAE